MRKLLLSFSALVLLLLVGCSDTAVPTTSPSDTTPAATTAFEFTETEHDFGLIKQSGGSVSYEFPFVYRGSESIEITGTPGNCLCTTGSLDKDSYAPGEAGILTVDFNPNLHAEPLGRFNKTVAILTNPSLDPIPEVTIWQEIDLDWGEEAFELSQHDDHLDGDEHPIVKDSEPKKEASLVKKATPTAPTGAEVAEIANDGQAPALAPLPADGIRRFRLTAKEVTAPLADGVKYNYWTYNGTVPGTFLRVREGEMVEFTLANDSGNRNKHSIDLHAVNGPGGGAGATQIYPGQEKTFRFQALNPGIYIYHCASSVIPEHVANGMYGLILVEPKEGLPTVDREYALVQGEIYSILKRGAKGTTQLSGEKMYAEDPEYIVFNGRVGALTGKRALTAKVGEKVRLFVGNGGVGKVSSFHVIGEIFDTVYPEGGTPVQNNIQTTVVPAGGATIVEFTVDVPGTYKIVDHALSRLTKGALALLEVTGAKNLEIFNDELK